MKVYMLTKESCKGIYATVIGIYKDWDTANAHAKSWVNGTKEIAEVKRISQGVVAYVTKDNVFTVTEMDVIEK